MQIEDREFVVSSLEKAGFYVARRMNTSAHAIHGDFDVGFKIKNTSVKCFLNTDKLIVVTEHRSGEKVTSNRAALAVAEICSQRVGLAHYFAEAIVAAMRGT